jgi:hypothetical protein
MAGDNDSLNSLPVGTILIWAGDVNHLPDGWYICDGNNNTVDLTDRIPMGQNAGVVQVGPLDTLSGPSTGKGTGPVAGSKAYDGGGAESYPVSGDHTHPLPVARVYFIQRTKH